MSAVATIGGVSFTMDVPLLGTDDTGFSDLALEARWFSGEPPDQPPIGAPMELVFWLDHDTRVVHLPVIDDHVEIRGWQLRQVAPAVAACFERLTLHASAVVVDRGVVAFVGGSGVGKSTMAWTLTKAGAKAVSDDLLPIRFDDDPYVPTVDAEHPIAAVCFLERSGDMLEASSLSSAEALQRHLVNGFGEHGRPEAWQFQFDAYHRLAVASPHVALTVPDDRSRLPEIADGIMSGALLAAHR